MTKSATATKASIHYIAIRPGIMKHLRNKEPYNSGLFAPSPTFEWDTIHAMTLLPSIVSADAYGGSDKCSKLEHITNARTDNAPLIPDGQNRITCLSTQANQRSIETPLNLEYGFPHACNRESLCNCYVNG